MRILVIDDSPDINDLLVKILSTMGHEVVSRDTGREGLKLIKAEPFDAVFLDIAMPDFSGLDVIDELERDGDVRKYNIILFTASSITDAEVDELVKRGVHSCLRKPVTIDNLFGKLQEIQSYQEKAASGASGGTGQP
jgi:CheY-like chemotaxis protein